MSWEQIDSNELSSIAKALEKANELKKLELEMILWEKGIEERPSISFEDYHQEIQNLKALLTRI